ncbi:cupin domain-containing protein [Flavobacterium sp. 2]|uniref:cupin domain-containing protein n=1 Tax=Flavobacterium sp. 2 TaxID=308053 RepID=UPI000C1997C9|nr:cupin domain-containing protein [Flavobacterium sp. 2]PIF70451.1 Cupin domain-containing protein [Flavobacterium sp. 2]
MAKDNLIDETAPTAAKIITAQQGLHQNILGDIQKIKLSGKDTAGRFTIFENDNPPGVGIPLHVHANEDEVFRILEGEMEFIVEGSTSVLKAGDTIFLPRQIPHSFKVVGEQNAKAIVTIIPSGIEEMFTQLNLLPAGPPDMKKILDICGSFGITFL